MPWFGAVYLCSQVVKINDISYIYIRHILVDKKFRGKGLGTEFVKNLLKNFVIIIEHNINPRFWSKFGDVKNVSLDFRKALRREKIHCPYYAQVIVPFSTSSVIPRT